MERKMSQLQNKALLVLCIAMLLSAQPTQAWVWEIAGAVVGFVAAPIVVPAALGAAGFTAAGITAGSAAAGMMSTYGGAVAAGSACAIAQSVGAAGVGVAGTVIGGGVGAAAGHVVQHYNED